MNNTIKYYNYTIERSKNRYIVESINAFCNDINEAKYAIDSFNMKWLKKTANEWTDKLAPNLIQWGKDKGYLTSNKMGSYRTTCHFLDMLPWGLK